MGGTNPYIAQPDVTLPKQKYSVTFLPMDITVEVDPDNLPCGDDGLKGSILNIALGNGVGIDHACGGVCACSTCHVVIREGFDALNQAADEEEDQLDEAPDLQPTSRLACQAVPNGTANMVVEIPLWNRNLVQEGH